MQADQTGNIALKFSGNGCYQLLVVKYMAGPNPCMVGFYNECHVVHPECYQYQYTEILHSYQVLIQHELKPYTGKEMVSCNFYIYSLHYSDTIMFSDVWILLLSCMVTQSYTICVYAWLYTHTALLYHASFYVQHL